MTRPFKLTLIWLLGSAAAFALSMQIAPLTFSQGDLVPMGPDSFYHARRILDAVADPGSFYQFDHRIHAPEGSWLTWPWGFDWTMAKIVRAVTFIVPAWRADNVLAYLPPLWLFVNVALVLGIAVALRLSLPLAALAVACFAFLPMTQNLHNVGRVDHHFAEHTFTLASLLGGLWWARGWELPLRGWLFGFILGVAPAYHNSLFVLQIPLLLWLAGLRLKGVALPRRGAGFLALGIVVGSLVAVLPSEPFWDGQFEFYTLSRFHLYVALCTALFAYALCRLPPGAPSWAGLIGGAVFLAMPLLGILASSYAWFALDYSYLDEINELRSLVGENRMPFELTLTLYSGLVLALPLTIVGLAWQGLKSVDAATVYFCIFALFGIAFLVRQVHFHYLGSFALYLPALLALQFALQRFRRRRALLWAAALAVLAGAYWLPVQSFLRPLPQTWDVNYYVTRDLYPRLAQACAQRPGVVLASLRDGHYIRYYTECSVIANVMIVTRQQHEKVELADRLLETTPAEIRDHQTWIGYVLVTRSRDGKPDSPSERQYLHGLPHHLLKPGDEFPPGYQLLAETTLATGEPAARVFRIVR